MYEYTFVETSLGGFFSAATHQQTIIEYAREGWRLVQVLLQLLKVREKPVTGMLVRFPAVG